MPTPSEQCPGSCWLDGSPALKAPAGMEADEVLRRAEDFLAEAETGLGE
jgi:hypothetical protein